MPRVKPVETFHLPSVTKRLSTKFFRLCARFMQRSSIPFLKCAALPSIMQCTLMACSLDHKEANTSVMKFLYDMVSSGKGNAENREHSSLVKQIVDEHGSQLVNNLIHACVFYLHTYMLCEVADVLVELLELNREQMGKWLASALETLPKQGNGGIISATPQQLNDFHISVLRSDTSKSVTHALKDLTRLYR